MKPLLKKILLFNLFEKIIFFFSKDYYLKLEKKIEEVKRASDFNAFHIENIKHLTNKRFSKAEEELTALTREKDSIEKELIFFKKKIISLEKFLASSQKEKNALKEELSFQNKSITLLQNELNKLKNDFFTKQKNLSEDITSTKKDLKNKIATQEENLSKEIRKIDELQKKNYVALNKNLDKQKRSLSSLYKNAFGKRDSYLFQNKDSQKGKRCFLIGSGPSVNKVDLSLLKDEIVMGVNGILYKKDLHLDYFCTVSHIWWQEHSEKLKNHHAKERVFLPHYIAEKIELKKASCLRALEDKYTSMHSEKVPLFFSEDPSSFIVTGGTVIVVALQILHYLGFDEVVLLGVDHNYIQKKQETDKNQKSQIVKSETIPHFLENYYSSNIDIHMNLKAMERGYNLANDYYKETGRKILNASPGTQLDIFEKVSYESLFSFPKKKKVPKKETHESSGFFTS